MLDGRRNYFLDFSDARFISPVERPLFDAFRAHQPGPVQYLQMLAGRGLANPHPPGDKHPADPVLNQIAVNLRRKMLLRILQPGENLQPPCAGKCCKRWFEIHIDN
jgi:hypothetical protein